MIAPPGVTIPSHLLLVDNHASKIQSSSTDKKKDNESTTLQGMIYLYWFGPSNFNFWPYLLPTAKRHKRCGQCTGCKTKDCGQCKFCKDMPKFGGLGRKKKPCVFRKCRGMPFASDEGKILCFCSTHSKNIISPAICLHILRAIKGMPQHTARWWPQSKHYRESIPNSSTTDWSKSTLYNARR